MDIKKIDKNFADAAVSDKSTEFHSPKEAPMVVSGLAWFDEDKEYWRIPKDMRKNFNEGLDFLCNNTSGASVRFRTDSKSIAIKAEVGFPSTMGHMTPLTGAGFDIYENDRLKLICFPPPQSTSIDASFPDRLGDGEKEITVNFPLYNDVKELYIGLDKGCKILPPTPYKSEKPIVFYGSSITQGGCASRPGNSYTTMISRWLNMPVLNFGFSGNAHGEPEMAELLASLDMSCFVYDYDHNAPSPEELERTHKPFFDIIRKKNPNLPIIMVSRATECDSEQVIKRKEIIYTTYKNAVDGGDENVYFLDGKEIYGEGEWDICTVDTCHPNDLGFYKMAKAICPLVENTLKKENII